jgi:hypothetical protein
LNPGRLRMWRSIVRPSISGIIMSSRIKRGCRLSRIARAWSARCEMTAFRP